MSAGAPVGRVLVQALRPFDAAGELPAAPRPGVVLDLPDTPQARSLVERGWARLVAVQPVLE